MKRRLIISGVFIAGLLIFTYPIISNWFATKEHYTVISKHNEALANMSKEDKFSEREKATNYNNALDETTIPIADPFSEENFEEENSGYYNVLDIGETIGTLEIPGINATLPIYHGIGDDVLQRGIGHMSNSSFPVGGEGTHSALTGHRGLPSSKLFRNLDKVNETDIFYIKTLDETLAYEVNDIQVVLPHEVSFLEIEEDKDYVTLITCEPYMINTHRLLVKGERIPYDAELASVSLSTPIDQSSNVLLYSVLGVGAIMVTIIISYYLFRVKKQRQGGWGS